MLLFSSDFADELVKGIEKASNELVICSAFIKTKAIENLLRNITRTVAVTIVARWAKQDLVFGASDLEVYQWCESEGYRFGVNSKLHAKLYSIDRDLIFLGSANLTHRGLSISGAGNVEVGTCFAPSVTDIEKVKRFLDTEVVWLDRPLFQKMSAEVLASKLINTESIDDWSTDISVQLHKKIANLWVSELLFTSPKTLLRPDFESAEIVHDFELLNLNIDNFDTNTLKNQFLKTRLYQWIRDTVGINNVVRFGWLTNQLHNALLDDATPNRSIIKEFMVTTFDWFRFMPELFEVTKVNVSETVRIKK